MRVSKDKTKSGSVETDLPDSLQDIFAHAFECIARVDYQGCYLSVNTAYAEVYGYAREEMIGMSWRETVHPEDMEIIEQKFQEVLDKGRSEAEVRGIRKNKSVFYQQKVMVRGLASDNSSLHHYCFIKDITERLLDELNVLKSVKTGLELQEQQYHNLINNIPDVVFRCDVNDYWSFDYLSTGIERLLGIPCQRLLASGSTSYTSLIHTNDREQAKRIIDSAISKKQSYTIEYRIQRADGELRWFRERAASTTNEQGVVISIGGIIRDITDSKESEKRLYIEKTLIENTNDAIFWLNEEGRYIYANNVACNMLGFEREELLQLSLFDIDINFTPESRRDLLITMSRSLSSSITHESTVRTKSNKECIVEITSSLVEINDEIFTCSLVKDITKQKYVELSHHIDQMILQLLSADTDQQLILETLSVLIEEMLPQARAAIFLLDNDGVHLNLIAAPKLNQHTAKSLNEIFVDMQVAGIHKHKFVIVDDIAQSLEWKEHREFAGQNDIAASWTTPFFSKRNQLLGCLTILNRQNCTPSNFEYDFLQKVSNLVSLVIETSDTREQVHRFEKIVESADDLIMYLDTRYRFRAVSNRYAESHGMTRDEVMGKFYSDIVGEKLFHDVIKPILDRSLGGEHFEFRDWFEQTKKGRGYYHVKLDPVREGGKVDGVVVIMRDITQLFNVSKDLEETQERYQHIIENSPDIMMITRLDDGKIISVNKAFERILGYAVEDVIGETSVRYYINIDDRSVLIDNLNRFGHYSGFETELRTSDGCKLKVLCSANLIDYHGERSVFSVIRNISESKMAETELKEKNRSIKLLQKVTLAANEASSIENVLQVCLDELCAYCDWPVGHAYILNTKTSFLESSDVWHLDSDSSNSLIKPHSDLAVFAENSGLPEWILKNEKYKWIEVIGLDDNFARASSDNHLDITSAFGFPIMGGNKVIAVLQFFNPRFVSRDEKVLDLATSISVQVGRIIERKQAELALQQSQINFSQAINATPDGVIIVRLDDGKILNANEAALTVTAYSHKELIEGGNVRMFWGSEDERKAYVRELKKKGRLANYSTQFKSKNGMTFPCLVSSTLMDVDGVQCVFSIVKDLSDLTAVHEQLREKKTQTLMITDAAPVCISYVDNELRYCFNNMQFEQELGISDESVIGKTIAEVVGAKEYKNIEAYLLAALAGNDVRFESVFSNTRGEQLIYELTYHPDRKDDIVKGIYIASSNITERKKTEIALIKTNRALRVLSESNNVLVKEQNEEKLLQAVCDLIVQAGGYHMAWAGYAALVKRGSIQAVAYATENKDQPSKSLAKEESQLDKRLARDVLATGRPYVIRNANDMGNNIKWRAEVLKRGHMSALGLPLKSREVTIGVLIITSTEVEAFDEEEMYLLASMAENLTYGIQSIRETGKREKAEQLLALENHAFQMISSFPTLSRLLDDLVKNIEVKLEGKYCSVLLMDKDQRRLYNGASPGLDASYVKTICSVETGENGGPCNRAVFLNKRIIIEDAYTDPLWIDYRELAQNYQLRSCCVTPITATGGRVIGTLAIYSKQASLPNPYELEIIDRMSYIIGSAIERYQTEQSLKENEERFVLAMQGSQDGLWDWNLDTNTIYFSPRWKSMLGYAEDELEQDISTFHRLIHPEDKGIDEIFKKEMRDNFEVEFKMKHKQGHYVDILSRATGLRKTAGGKLIRLVGTHVDLTERNRTALHIKESESQFRTLYDDSPSMMFTLDEQGVILSLNKYGADHLGFSVEDLIGKSILDITHVDDGVIIMQKLKACTSHPNKVQRCEIRKMHNFGDAVWVRASMRSIGLEKDQQNILVTCEDISEARILSDQLEYQAKHDGLTGLINRVEFEKRLRRVLYAESDDVDHALCYLDLDQFKVINDTCGHLAGDELLRRISDILNTVVRKRDTLARMGGDEFAVLLEHCPIEQAKRVANELLRCIETLRFVWEGKRFTLGVSIGLVPMRSGSGSLTDILSAADEACYAAKDAGRNRIHVYYSDDIELSRRRGEMEWVSKINHVLEEDRFCLEMQSIRNLDIKTNQQGNHYEILLRMRADDGQLIYPDAFLPAAERYNLSEKIDRWVVATTLEWLAGDKEELAALAVCSINLSGHSMGDDAFLDFLLGQFDQSIVSPAKICFEITETAAIANLGAAIEFIHALKEIGCLFALDDFGTGVSSFNYLKNLPVDFLKIDGSFIREIHKDPIDFAMVRSINEIAQVMGKHTIAEFVENDAILKVLRDLGVNYAQGYVIGRPTPINYK